MNQKIIKSILTKRIKDWASSIEDNKVRELVLRDTIVTGGAIASMLLNEDVKDYDVYFKTRETAIAVAQYYVQKFNTNYGSTKAVVLTKEIVEESRKIGNIIPRRESLSDEDYDDLVEKETSNLDEDRIKIFIASSGVAADKEVEEVLDKPFEDVVEEYSTLENKEDVENKSNYRPVFLSSNAITLTDKIQIIIRFFGSPEEIHKNYDFVHCTNYWTSSPNELVLNQPALLSLMNKELIYQGSKYPICSVIRTRKFLKRGFHINAGQYLKMCYQISHLDLNDISVLEDQLVGVDSAFFARLIDGLRSKKKSDPDFDITNDYIVEIIDRIF